MGHGKGKSSTSYETAPAHLADYHVSGILSHTITGNYYEQGTFGGKPKYRRYDLSWYIYWHVVAGRWIISAVLGSQAPPVWFRADPNIVGEYQPSGGTGIATVSPGPE